MATSQNFFFGTPSLGAQVQTHNVDNLYIINKTTQNYSTAITMHGERQIKIQTAQLPTCVICIMIKDCSKFSKDFKIVVHAEMY
jgi:hypothetical protein